MTHKKQSRGYMYITWHNINISSWPGSHKVYFSALFDSHTKHQLTQTKPRFLWLCPRRLNLIWNSFLLQPKCRNTISTYRYSIHLFYFDIQYWLLSIFCLYNFNFCKFLFSDIWKLSFKWAVFKFPFLKVHLITLWMRPTDAL